MKSYLRRWVADAGFWSMVDQGVVSAGNFLTTILVARALLPPEYGIYALLFGLMLFAISLYMAVIAYGLSLHGAVGTDAELRQLAGGSLVLAAVLGIALGAAAGVVAVFFHRASLAPWILLAVLFWQLQETTRRALISRLRLREAVWGDALSYLGQAACVAYLFVGHRLTLTSAFATMAVTSATAALFQVSQLKLIPPDFRGALRLLPKFWGVGRWALLANIAQAFIGPALLWLLAFGGTAEAASFQSLLNLVRVVNPVMFAIGGVLLPTVAANRDGPAGLRATRRYGLLGLVVLLPYFVVIFISPSATLRLLYGTDSAYAGLGTELRVLVIGSAFAYVAYVLGMYYYGLSRSDIVLRCGLVAAATAVVGGLVLVTHAGVLGAAATYDLTFAAGTGAFVWFLRRPAPSPGTLPLSIGDGERLDAEGN